MRIGLLLLLLFSSLVSVATAEPLEVSLWEGKAPLGNGKTEEAEATLLVYRPEKPNGVGMVICPGGAYSGLVLDHEGEFVAKWLNEHGVTAMVLLYRLPAGRSMVPLLDAQRAIRTARANAKEWGIDPAKIGVCGFSAGGHLASTAGTRFERGNPKSDDAVARQSSRPDFLILIYPVISMGPKGHDDSRTNLLGENPTQAEILRFSNERNVSKDTPPTFLAHAKDDEPVPPANSEMFHKALQANGVQSELLLLPSGGHGLDEYSGPMWETWKKRSLEWLAELKILPKGAAKKP